jgi:hypothetical protein
MNLDIFIAKNVYILGRREYTEDINQTDPNFFPLWNLQSFFLSLPSPLRWWEKDNNLGRGAEGAFFAEAVAQRRNSDPMAREKKHCW